MLITNQLSASQAADIASLEADCKKAENLMGSIFLSSELNFDPDLPCFYLLYHPEHPSTLIAIVKRAIFVRFYGKHYLFLKNTRSVIFYLYMNQVHALSHLF